MRMTKLNIDGNAGIPPLLIAMTNGEEEAFLIPVTKFGSLKGTMRPTRKRLRVYRKKIFQKT